MELLLKLFLGPRLAVLLMDRRWVGPVFGDGPSEVVHLSCWLILLFGLGLGLVLVWRTTVFLPFSFSLGSASWLLRIGSASSWDLLDVRTFAADLRTAFFRTELCGLAVAEDMLLGLGLAKFASVLLSLIEGLPTIFDVITFSAKARCDFVDFVSVFSTPGMLSAVGACADCLLLSVW